MSAVIVLRKVWASEPEQPEQVVAAAPVVAVINSQEQTTVEMVRVPAELAFYRKYTEAILRRYMQTAMESGKVPSLLGRDMFRGRVSNYQVKSFEDAVIFVHDVETCMAKLSKLQQELIRRITLQEYTQGEAAGLMGLSLRSVLFHYGAAVDRLTGIFLKVKLLVPMVECKMVVRTTLPEAPPKCCQGVNGGLKIVSD